MWPSAWPFVGSRVCGPASDLHPALRWPCKCPAHGLRAALRVAQRATQCVGPACGPVRGPVRRPCVWPSARPFVGPFVCGPASALRMALRVALFMALWGALWVWPAAALRTAPCACAMRGPERGAPSRPAAAVRSLPPAAPVLSLSPAAPVLPCCPPLPSLFPAAPFLPGWSCTSPLPPRCPFALWKATPHAIAPPCSRLDVFPCGVSVLRLAWGRARGAACGSMARACPCARPNLCWPARGQVMREPRGWPCYLAAGLRDTLSGALHVALRGPHCQDVFPCGVPVLCGRPCVRHSVWPCVRRSVWPCGAWRAPWPCPMRPHLHAVRLQPALPSRPWLELRCACTAQPVVNPDRCLPGATQADKRQLLLSAALTRKAATTSAVTGSRPRIRLSIGPSLTRTASAAAPLHQVASLCYIAELLATPRGSPCPAATPCPADGRRGGRLAGLLFRSSLRYVGEALDTNLPGAPTLGRGRPRPDGITTWCVGRPFSV